MGKPIENEVVLRSRAKEVKALILEEKDVDKAIELIREYPEILSFDFGRNKYLSLLPTIRLEKGLSNKYYFLKRVIRAAIEIYAQNRNYEELAFFAAAGCDLDNLNQAMDAILEDSRRKTREGDTILVFFIKYANLDDTKYIPTLKLLTNQYKLSVNQADYKDQTPIAILLNKYDLLQEKRIKRYNDVILNAASIILTRSDVDITSHRLNGKTAQNIIEQYDLKDYLEELKKKNRYINRIKSEKEEETGILFALLAQKNEVEFLDTIDEMKHTHEDIFDIEDGNNTLLQLATEKNLKTVVDYLIKRNANLSKTTNRNRKTPLEIAARRNYPVIFKELLKTNKIVIDLKLFTVFLLNRGRQIKTKYFDEILCYDGLQPDIVYENGNTPLHYAMIFGNTEATLKLLKRGASLLVRNKVGKAPIDFISKEDLELYFDQCLVLDNHNKVHSRKYELRLDFSGLLEKNPSSKRPNSEVEVLSKICSTNKLKCLATHPLILAFMEIKWNAISPFYNNILAIYGFTFFYYMILTLCIGHITLLFLTILLLLIFLTFQPSINLKNKRNYLKVFLYISFTILVYCLVHNKHISTCILMSSLMHQFLQQHLHFAKYQALVVNGIRKVTPHVIALFGLLYLSNFESNLSNSKIIIPLVSYMLVVTFSFNALVDSVDSVEHSFRNLYNHNTLNFLRFTETVYSNNNTILCNPFILDDLKTISPNEKNKKDKRLYLNYYINRNKFVSDKFHFLKLTSLTAKTLQAYVARVSQKK